MLKIFADQFRKPVDFGIGPQVSIEPGELVGGRTAESSPYDGVIGIENGKLAEQLLGFPISLLRAKERRGIAERAARIKAIDEDVGVNQGGHECRGPHASNPGWSQEWLGCAPSRGLAAFESPGRTVSDD